MSKIKIMSGIGVAVFLMSFAGGYFFLQDDGTQLASGLSNESQIAENENFGQTASPSQSVPLTQTTPTPVASGLQTGSNAGSNSATQAASNQAQSQGQSQNRPNPFDPKTFAQYDKYKNDPSASYADALVGEGAVLDNGKKAAVYYRGWLTNGAVFDESRVGADGKMTPFIFTMGKQEVIPGWEQALSGMKVGGVRLVIVPPAAGYGASPQNGIPANSLLVFQVQLAEVQ